MRKNRLLICFIVLTAWHATVRATSYDTLSHFGSYWKYLDDGSNQDSTAWKTLAFSDGTWGCGPSPIGYGDCWIVTCIQSGCTSPDNTPCAPLCDTKTITDWFRKKINIANVADYDSVSMDALFDDGAIVYVNGTQVWNYNMPTTWNYTTWSSSTISGAAETTQVHLTIPISVWVTGENQVAVEMHQRGPTSSDVTLDMQFRFRLTSSASTSVANNYLNNDDKFNVYPNPSKGSFTIESNNPALSGENINMAVFDITGRKVSEQVIQFVNNKTNVTLALLPGMYQVRLITNEINTTLSLNIQK